MAATEETPLIEITGLSGANGFFREKEFLSIKEIYYYLVFHSGQMHKAGSQMISNIETTRCDLSLQSTVPLEVVSLHHVTTQESMMEILDSEGFCGSAIKYGCFGEDHPDIELCYWSAQVSESDIQKVLHDAIREVYQKLPIYNERKFRTAIREQFANSPAFDAAKSRYGHFKFSFPLSEILSAYKDQFCSGSEPQLRMLGTTLYKQEIVHTVLVHSPGVFHDLPLVETIDMESNPMPFVFRKWENGTKVLYWRPESTSSTLRVRVSDAWSGDNDCPEYCAWFQQYRSCCHRKDPCVWNHLVFAFHVPANGLFEFPEETLKENLSACLHDGPIPKEPQMDMEAVEQIIWNVQNNPE
ncbi:hypothetical protein XELAEV_18016515mg [Xenopus laevis]|uniref:Uncharacterized protein n=1 Tax=Xenopus laevis TaxID=8355 RepID=A0A974DM14_XENLA|nr:hypothetical protein XELAEV_18016515mg [Xenopus laevis]